MCVQTWGRRVELKELKISVNSIIVDQDFLITRPIFTSLHMMLEAYTKRLLDHGEGLRSLFFFFRCFVSSVPENVSKLSFSYILVFTL